MEVNIRAVCYRRSRGYQGADLALPAGPYEIADAFQRAHVPEGGSYRIDITQDWPFFLQNAIGRAGPLSGGNVLGELNFLADVVGRMDSIQLGSFEGAVCLHLEEKGGEAVTLGELVNLAMHLDDYEFHPGVTSDRILGEACMKGGLPELMDKLPAEMYELIAPAKVGKIRRLRDRGIFTGKGYVYRSSRTCGEIYDGQNLPACEEKHGGVLSLRIEKAGTPERCGGVWLELPADENALQSALLAVGEESFEGCLVAEVKGIIPAFRYRLAGCRDIGKLNMLAKRLVELTREPQDSLMLMKYKAVLELDQYYDLDKALEAAANLGCYNYSQDVISAGAYGEYALQSAGIDTDDPAFLHFDFDGYGKRLLGKDGYVFTCYGAVSHNGQELVHEYKMQAQDAQNPGQGMVMGQ